MTFWTYQNLADVTNGQWLVEPDDLQQQVAGLWHDTRDIKPGQAYLAIKGDNFDGHDFLDKAFDAGAALAIVQSELPSLEGGAGGRVPSQPVLQVEDTVKALQDLARAYRDELKRGGCKVIGIAGSNGKTTTRHLIHHVLTHAGLKGIQSPKSFNNHLGVPLTLLSGKPQDDFVACEIGTNHPGEIDFLSAIARPDIAVITSIGEEHLEFFKDLEGVAEEESDILKYIGNRGTAVVPGEKDLKPMLSSANLSKCPNGSVVHYIGWVVNGFAGESHMGPRRKPNYRPEQDGFTFRFSSVTADRWSDGLLSNRLHFWHWNEEKSFSDLEPIELRFPGKHNGFNAIIAILVAEQFRLDQSIAVECLQSCVLPDQRLTVRQIGDRTNSVSMIDDAYNANPSSMREAIRMMGLHQENNNASSVLILGDMYELGEQAEVHHHSIGNFLAPMDCDYIGTKSESISRVVLIGPLMQNAREPIETAWTRKADGRLYCFPEWSDELPDKIAALLQPGDTVLLKASRGMRLERLIPAIERRFGAPQRE